MLRAVQRHKPNLVPLGLSKPHNKVPQCDSHWDNTKNAFFLKIKGLGERVNWKVETDIYTQLYTKQIINKNLLTPYFRDSIQPPVMT